jgi:hypothetical protein
VVHITVEDCGRVIHAAIVEGRMWSRNDRFRVGGDTQAAP